MSLRALFVGLFLVVLVFPVTALAGGWMIYHDGPYTGVVLDDETGAPIVGAAVVAEWKLYLYGGAGGPISEFFDVSETITDEQGKFTVDSKIGFYWWPFASIRPVRLTIFKPGYDSYPPKLPIISSLSSKEDHEKANLYLEKFYVKIYQSKLNTVRLAKAVTRENRKHIVTTQNVYIFDINGKNPIPYFCKLIEDERKYLGFHN